MIIMINIVTPAKPQWTNNIFNIISNQL